MTEVQNPVLRGFNPDPSMLRVGDDYYLATSTFEWFPAVQIYHSRDLVNWRLIIRPLDQIDLRGCGPSCGVWAPDLSFDGKRYYLAYTIVHTKVGFKDTHNYIVSAPSIMGPWSAPSYLGSFGFDPSLFHDKDGRKWTVTMTTDNRKGKSPFAGIILQEWDARKQKNIGEKELIWNGTRIGRTEAPHIYHLGRYYYLFCAEGGTYYPHAESVARALSIHGPYEAMPGNPLLTSNVDACGGYDYENEIPKNPRGLPLEKSGHAALVELPEGKWVIAHLCGRPLGERYCILGRETALQNIIFDKDDWPRLEKGGIAASCTFNSPYDAFAEGPIDKTYGFSKTKLDMDFQTLRRSLGPDMMSFNARKGYLRLYGHEGPSSCFDQSLVGRRQQAFSVEVTTQLDFHPAWFKEMAGLSHYYNTDEYSYLALTHDEDSQGRVLRIFTCDNGVYDEAMAAVRVPDDGELWLRLTVRRTAAQYGYSLDGKVFRDVGPELDALRISDDYIAGYAFTGAFFALCCQDMSGMGKYADFKMMHYRELEG